MDTAATNRRRRLPGGIAAALALAAGSVLAWPGAAGASDTPVSGSPAPVLVPASGAGGEQATASAIAARVAPAVRKSGAAAIVIDPASGEVLLDTRADAPLMPASTAKLPTAAAALTVLGPDTRLATIVRAEGDDVYLVGGGDPSLRRTGRQRPGGPASLAALAKETAAQLGASARVRLVFDDHAFTGPVLGPGWPSGFPAAGVVPPITSLSVDGGRATPGGNSRVSDPSRQAAEMFASQLREQGVTVTSVRAGRARAQAAEIARVESAPVADLVQFMLTESDNAYAESLAHLVGGAALGKPSFRGGAQATRQALQELGISTDGFGLVDASGLSRRDRLTPTTLAGILTAVTAGEHPELAYIAPGLAVAGLTGTLADRFTAPATRPGRGYVQAKTGTLTGVVSLAGLVRTKENGTLAFALIRNGAGSITAARDTMDSIASRLATCGCS